MSCTDETPCKAPILRWVHSDKCKEWTKQILPVLRQARELYQDENIQIDDDPELSDSETGTWVQAWVFVPNEES